MGKRAEPDKLLDALVGLVPPVPPDYVKTCNEPGDMPAERKRWGLDLAMVRNSSGGWNYEWQDQHGAVRCSGWTLALDPEQAADDAERHLLRAGESAGENERNLVALLDLYQARAEKAEAKVAELKRQRDEARADAAELEKAIRDAVEHLDDDMESTARERLIVMVDSNAAWLREEVSGG